MGQRRVHGESVRVLPVNSISETSSEMLKLKNCFAGISNTGLHGVPLSTIPKYWDIKDINYFKINTFQDITQYVLNFELSLRGPFIIKPNELLNTLMKQDNILRYWISNISGSETHSDYFIRNITLNPKICDNKYLFYFWSNAFEHC